MDKISIALLLGVLLLPLASGACIDAQRIFRISATTNAHAEEYNGAGGYTEEICYDSFFSPPYAGANPHNCSSNTVLWASDTTNAHVAQANDPGYSTQICFGNLSCRYANTLLGEDCIAGETCIATISASTNAHVSSLCTGVGSYSTKICCSSAVIPSDCGDGFVTGSEACDIGSDRLPGTPDDIAGSCTGSCQAGCTCGAVPTPFLQITAFSAGLSGSNPGSDFSSIDVTVKNIGTAAVTPQVQLEVLDPLTNQQLVSLSPSGKIDCPLSSVPTGSVDPGSECSWQKPQFPGFSVSSLGPGTYKLVAKAYDRGTGALHDTADFYFSIVRPIPIPELSEFLLPLIACVVLAIMFFAARKH